MDLSVQKVNVVVLVYLNSIIIGGTIVPPIQTSNVKHWPFRSIFFFYARIINLFIDNIVSRFYNTYRLI